jgi:hypothetical protein
MRENRHQRLRFFPKIFRAAVNPDFSRRQCLSIPLGPEQTVLPGRRRNPCS